MNDKIRQLEAEAARAQRNLHEALLDHATQLYLAHRDEGEDPLEATCNALAAIGGKVDFSELYRALLAGDTGDLP